MAPEIPVTDLLEIDTETDEAGTPDDHLVRCACGTIHRVGDSVHPTVCEVLD